VIPLKVLLKQKKTSALLELLKEWAEGRLRLKEEDLKEVAASGTPQLLYWLARGALERGGGLIGELFGVELLSAPVEFDFPVVGRESKVVKGIAFKSSKEVKNKEDAPLEAVKAFLNSNVAVFFEDVEFQGSSFQAPLAYALYAGGIPNGVMLTGELEADGDFRADGVEEKRKLAREAGKFLIWKGRVKELSDFLSQEELHLPFLMITSQPEEVETAFKLLESGAGLKTVKGLDWERLSLILPQTLPARLWHDFVEEALESFKEFNRLPLNYKLHLGVKAPSALALGVGASLGTEKLPLVLYRYQNRVYQKVIDLTEDSRKIKRRVSTLSKFRLRSELRGKERALVALQIASHETEKRARVLAEELDADFFYAEHLKKGALSQNPKEWEETVAEAYEVMNRVYNSSSYKEIHLIMSVPVPIAFALGMALGSYWPVKVWNFFKDRGEYRPVLELSNLPSL